MSTLDFDSLSQMSNSTASLKKPVDARQFFNITAPVGCFTKIRNEWKNGTSTDMNLAQAIIAALNSTAIASTTVTAANINTGMSSVNTIGTDDKTVFHGDGSLLTGIIAGGGDTLAVLEQRVNNAQAGVGSSGSNDGILDDHTTTPWVLSGSTTISAGGSGDFTVADVGGLVNIEANNSYVLKGTVGTGSSKQEIIRVAAATYSSDTWTITPEDVYVNSYAAGYTLSPCGGTTSNNSLQPTSAAVSGDEPYTKTISISHETIEEIEDPIVECSYRVSEKWFYVSGMTDATTITLTSIAGDAAIMPQYYETTPVNIPFKGILFKLDKKGDKLVSPKSAALGGKNFIVLTHSGAATGTTTTTVPLTTVNPVYGTAEASQTFNNDGASQLKWGYLPLTELKELSVVDEASFESWVAMTIEKIIISGNNILALDDFNRANSPAYNSGLGGNWTTVKHYQSEVDSAGFMYSIYNNMASFGATNNRTMVIGSYWPNSSISPRWEGYFDIKQNGNIGNSGENGRDYGFSVFFGGTSQNGYNSGGICIGVKFYRAANDALVDTKIFVYENGINGTQIFSYVYETGVAIGGTRSVRIRYENGFIKIKIWPYGTSEPNDWTKIWQYLGNLITTNNWGLISKITTLINEINTNQNIGIDNFKINSLANIVIRGAAINGTGNKLSEKTTIYSFGRANSMPAELGSVVYAK